MRGTLIAAATMTILAGCSTYDSVTQSFAQHITPYRITVVQGNFVSAEAASQMKVGLTRDQVKTLLGTPLLADMFHADRWDYVFYFKRGSTSVVQQRDFVVLFAGNTVASWSGGENLPSNLELLAEIDGDKGVKLAAATAAATAASANGASAIDATAAAGTSAGGTGITAGQVRRGSSRMHRMLRTHLPATRTSKPPRPPIVRPTPCRHPRAAPARRPCRPCRATRDCRRTSVPQATRRSSCSVVRLPSRSRTAAPWVRKARRLLRRTRATV